SLVSVAGGVTGCRLRLRFFAWSVFTAIVVAASMPAQTRACTCDFSAIDRFESMPRPGATDVPLNFAPVIEGAFVPGSITVEDEGGEPVDVTINEGPPAGCSRAWAEIIPKHAWRARATYTIRVAAMLPDEWTANPDPSLTFVTGVDVLPDL